MGFVLALISSAAFGLIPLFSLPLLHSGLSADCVLFYRFLFASISLGLISSCARNVLPRLRATSACWPCSACSTPWPPCS